MTGRVLAVLDAVAAGKSAVSLAELTRAVGIPKATVRRIAEDLCSRQMLRRSTDGGYLLGQHMVELGTRATVQLGLRDAATPHLQELLARTGEIAWIGARTGATITSVGSVYGANRATAIARHGWAMDPGHPAFLTTAAGRLVLAEDPEIADRLRTRPVRALTPRTVTSWSRLAAVFDSVRDSGIAVEHEESALGFSCVAIGLRDRNGDLIGALGVTGHTGHLSVPRLTRSLRLAADDITRTLTAS